MDYMPELYELVRFKIDEGPIRLLPGEKFCSPNPEHTIGTGVVVKSEQVSDREVHYTSYLLSDVTVEQGDVRHHRRTSKFLRVCAFEIEPL